MVRQLDGLRSTGAALLAATLCANVRTAVERGRRHAVRLARKLWRVRPAPRSRTASTEKKPVERRSYVHAEDLRDELRRVARQCVELFAARSEPDPMAHLERVRSQAPALAPRLERLGRARVRSFLPKPVFLGKEWLMTPTAAQIRAEKYRLIAEAEMSRRFLRGCGQPRPSYDFIVRFTDLGSGLGKTPTRVLVVPQLDTGPRNSKLGASGPAAPVAGNQKTTTGEKSNTMYWDVAAVQKIAAMSPREARALIKALEGEGLVERSEEPKESLGASRDGASRSDRRPHPTPSG